MKQSAKKLLSMMLTMALVFSGIPAFAAEDNSPSLGLSGTITGFAYVEPIEVEAGTAEADIPFPATVTATVSFDDVATPAQTQANEADIDVSVGEWRLAFGSYDPDAENTRFVFEAVRESLDLPDGIALPVDVDLPCVAVDIGEVEIGIAALNTAAPSDGFNFTSTGAHAAEATYDGTSGIAHWNGSDTLTLTNFVYAPASVTSNNAAIRVPAGTEIVLVGTNSLTTTVAGTAGIKSAGSLKISGDGALTVTVSGGNNDGIATLAGGSLEITGGTIKSNATGGGAGTAYGVTLAGGGSGTLTVTNGSLEAFGENAGISFSSTAATPYTGTVTGGNTTSDTGTLYYSATDKKFQITSGGVVAKFVKVVPAVGGGGGIPAPTDGFNFTSTGAHAAEATYTDGNGGTAHWSGQTSKILTLTNFEYTTALMTAITVPGNTTIKLVGTSTIASTFTTGNTYGIHVSGTLTIESVSGSSGVLNVTAGNSTSGNSYGLFSNGTLTIQNCKVVATGGTAGNNNNSAGVNNSSGTTTLTLTNATLECEGGNPSDSGASYGLYNGSTITVSGADSVLEATSGTATTSKAIHGGAFTNTDSLPIIGGADSNASETLTFNANSFVYGGSIIAKYVKIGTAGGGTPSGGSGTQHGYYALAWNDIVNAGDTIVTERAAATSAGLRFKTPDGTNIEIPNVSTNATGNVDMSADGASVTVPSDYPTYRVSATQSSPMYYLTFTAIDAPAPVTNDFTLKFARESGSWKLLKYKNGTSQGDYTATGISFSGDTLTLNNFNFTTTAGTALETGDGARIVLNGTSTIEASGGAGRSIVTSGNLSVSGTGTLNANGGITMGSGDLSISGGTINAVSDAAAQDSHGIASSGGGNIRVSGGTLNTKGAEYGIITLGPIYVEGSGKITAEGGYSAIASVNYTTAPIAVTIQGGQTGGTLGAVVWMEVSGGDGGASICFYSTDGTPQTVATYVELNGGSTPPPPPTTTPTPSSGGSSSNQTTPAPAPVISPMDNKSSGTLSTAINAAASAASSDGKNFDVRLKNVSNFTKENAAAIIAKAKSLGKPATVSSDVMSENGRFVEVRVTVDPALITKTVRLDGYIRESQIMLTASRFTKHFSNQTAVVHLAQEGKFGQTAKISAKVDLNGFDSTNLFLYSYDRKANKYSLITSKDYKIDKNGYLVFNTDFGGDVIISNGKLEKK